MPRGRLSKKRLSKKQLSKKLLSRRSNRLKHKKRISKKMLGLGVLGLGAMGLKNYYDSKNFVIEVMADVEGSWDKIVSFMTNSKIFKLKGGKITSENFKPKNYDQIEMITNSKFVCLGDTIDKGPNNLAILRLLKHLKETYKNQVIFIVGNRDLNKLRLKYEIRNKKPRMNLDRLLLNVEKVKLTNGDYEHMIPIDRLKWILVNTMGCPKTFDFMKEEIENGNDQDVLDKYEEILDEVGNGDEVGKGDKGLLTYYLRNGNLIYYDKKTKSLFVHGGVNCKNFNKSGPRSVSDWVDKLNKWYKNELNKAYKGTDESEIEELLLYQDERNYIKDEKEGAINSVILSRPWKTPPIKNSGPGVGTSIVDEKCFDKISREVKFIFTGHTPVGQMPIMMSTELRRSSNNKEIIFVFCDTSFADRVGNVRLINGIVEINAQYEKNGENVSYSSNDLKIGSVIDNKLVIAKIKDKYILGKWNEMPNAEMPDFITAEKYEFKILP